MKKGFTLVELLIALAILCIAMTPVLPAMTKAQQDAQYATQSYQAQSHAQALVLAVKAALYTSVSPQIETEAYADGLNEPLVYAFWIFDADGTVILSYFSEGALGMEVHAVANGLPTATGGRVVSVVVWDDINRPVSRAVGCVI